MIKFFRGIRKTLLAEKRFSKYLLYAIGEIVLVVIGILIALQIDNWNEQGKNEAKIDKLFNEVLGDIESNIYKIDDILKGMIDTDSIATLILNDKYNAEDFRDKSYLHTVNFFSFNNSYNQSQNGYKSLMNSIEEIPDTHKGLLKNLEELYGMRTKEVFEFQKSIYTLSDEIDKYHVLNTSWYSSEWGENENEEAIKYYTQSPIYKNWVALCLKKREAYREPLKKLKQSCILNYFYIRDRVNSDLPIPEFIPRNVIELSDEELLKYVGCYSLDNWTFFIRKHNGYLLFGDKNSSTYLLTTNKDGYFVNEFSNDYDSLMEFEKDEKGEVVSMNYLVGDHVEKAQKLDNCD